MKHKDSAKTSGAGKHRATWRLRRSGGFSLIELMIVVAVVAILVALSLPSYTAFVRKANRGEAQKLLMNWANMQEIWRANNPTYADDVAAPNGIPLPVHDKYTFSLGAPNPPTATQYVLIATADGDQALDEQGGVSCTPMTLNQANIKTNIVCW